MWAPLLSCPTSCLILLAIPAPSHGQTMLQLEVHNGDPFSLLTPLLPRGWTSVCVRKIATYGPNHSHQCQDNERDSAVYWLQAGTLGPHSLILTITFDAILDRDLTFSEPLGFFTREEYLPMTEAGLLKYSIPSPTLPSPV